MTNQQILNLKADRLEGLFYQHEGCPHATHKWEYGKLNCREKDCKRKEEYKQILNKIEKRTEAL